MHVRSCLHPVGRELSCIVPPASSRHTGLPLRQAVDRRHRCAPTSPMSWSRTPQCRAHSCRCDREPQISRVKPPGWDRPFSEARKGKKREKETPPRWRMRGLGLPNAYTTFSLSLSLPLYILLLCLPFFCLGWSLWARTHTHTQTHVCPWMCSPVLHPTYRRLLSIRSMMHNYLCSSWRRTVTACEYGHE